MRFQMVQLEEKEKTRRIIGAVLLCVGILCILWGDQGNNFAVLKFGRAIAVVGIILYFLGRIGKLLQKNE
jgi:drug/metabolite transporter (DMT)-like permease